MAAVLIDSGQRLDSANSYGDNALHILCRRAADTAREIVGKERFISSFNEQWVSEKRQREAREELEEFLRKKVFLQLFVKVSEDWRNDQRQLRRFGYDPQ